jgi:hypothetical protein
MTALIRQRFKNDCMLCSIAMAVDIDYDTALGRWGDEFVAHVAAKGLYGQENIGKAFAAFDLEMNRDYWSLLGPASGVPRDFALPSGPFKSMLKGRRALVQARSKNYEGQSHVMFWNGAELFDPSPLKTYAWDECNPEHVWIFEERPWRRA